MIRISRPVASLTLDAAVRLAYRARAPGIPVMPEVAKVPAIFPAFLRVRNRPIADSPI